MRGATAPRIVAGKRLKSSLNPTNVAGLQVRRRAQSLKTIQRWGVRLRSAPLGSARIRSAPLASARLRSPPLGSARLRSAPLGALYFFPSPNGPLKYVLDRPVRRYAGTLGRR